MDVTCLIAIAIVMIGSIVILLTSTLWGSSNSKLNNFLTINKSYRESKTKSQRFIVVLFGIPLMLSPSKIGFAVVIVSAGFAVAGNICNPDMFAQIAELFKVIFQGIRGSTESP
jgi:hypothetical protein